MEGLEQHFKKVSKSDFDSRTQTHEFLTEVSSGPEDEVCTQAGAERENGHEDDDEDEDV